MNRCAFILTLLSALQVWSADRVETPTGNYQLLRLRFEKAAPTKERQDIEELVPFRDGKASTPSTRSVREIIATLTLTDKHLTGTYAHFGNKDDGKPLVLFTVEASASGGNIEGRYKGTIPLKGTTFEGAVTGKLISEAELQGMNAFSGKADWPCWSGPTQSLAATPCGLKLVDNLAAAKLLWRSEDRLPSGLGNLTAFSRRLNEALSSATTQGTRTGGGGASPVFADGRVYSYYFQPAGEKYDEAKLKALAELAAKAGITEISPYSKEKLLQQADDVVVCMDAVTGRTLWKTTFELKGANTQDHKSGPTNCTPCVGGGRVFTLASAGLLYALDAVTGKPLWEKKLGPDLAGTRDFNNAPILVGNVVVTGDQRTTLYGFDAATGKELWKLPGANHPYAVPVVWRQDQSAYVLSHTMPQKNAANPSSEMYCIEPATGKVLWKTVLDPLPGKGLCVVGDTVVVLTNMTEGEQKPPAGTEPLVPQCAAYRMTLNGAEMLWKVPCGYVTVHIVPAAAPGGPVLLAGPKDVRALDVNTGKEIAALSNLENGRGAANEGYIYVAEDRVFIRPDGSHGDAHIQMFGPLPASLQLMGPLWSPPHNHTTSYHMKPMTSAIVEGRLFMRGHDGIFCYDLRAK